MKTELQPEEKPYTGVLNHNMRSFVDDRVHWLVMNDDWEMWLIPAPVVDTKKKQQK